MIKINNVEEFKIFANNNFVQKEGYLEFLVSKKDIEKMELVENIEKYCSELGYEMFLENDNIIISVPDFHSYESLIEMCLKEAEIEIKNEIEKTGYICDSDLTERFLDNLSLKLIKDHVFNYSKDEELIFTFYNKDIKNLADDLLQEFRNNILCDYNIISETDERGNFTGYYTLKDFDSLEEFYKFYNIGGK